MLFLVAVKFNPQMNSNLEIDFPKGVEILLTNKFNDSYS